MTNFKKIEINDFEIINPILKKYTPISANIAMAMSNIITSIMTFRTFPFCPVFQEESS